jgi:hypothetical protein
MRRFIGLVLLLGFAIGVDQLMLNGRYTDKVWVETKAVGSKVTTEIRRLLRVR